MDLTAVYRGNMDDINRYLTNEVGRDMDFGTEQLGELLNAVNTDDFWDGLLEELPDNDLLQDNDSGEDSSGESVIVRESSTPPVDSHTSVASNDEIGHFLKRREFWNELSSMDKEVSWPSIFFYCEHVV